MTFAGGDPDVTLAGTLTRASDAPDPIPPSCSSAAAGAQDRDESLRPVSAIKPLALRGGCAVATPAWRSCATTTGSGSIQFSVMGQAADGQGDLPAAKRPAQ